MNKVLASLAAVSVLSAAAFASGCSSDSEQSTPESRLAETQSALAASCEAGVMGAQCLEARLACAQEDAACRSDLVGCLAGEESAMAGQRRQGDAPGAGSGDCTMGDGHGGKGKHGAGGGHRHFTPDATAIAQCHTDARACVQSGADAGGCVATARSCVQAVMATAFETMCADHAAACEGSTAASCAQIAGICNRGPRACGDAANL